METVNTMKSPTYCHTIRFHGSAYPHSRYQLQISEMSSSGKVHYRAQWSFPTMKKLFAFLKKYFPNSQALAIGERQSLGFEAMLSVVDLNELKVA